MLDHGEERDLTEDVERRLGKEKVSVSRRSKTEVVEILAWMDREIRGMGMERGGKIERSRRE